MHFSHCLARVENLLLADGGLVPPSRRFLAVHQSHDVQLGLTVGYTLFDVWRLYLAPRVFGGPIFIDAPAERIQGRDRYFVQAGMGMGFILPKGITLYIDGSPAGQQSVSAGLAYFIPVD